jgi:hypothetical protein
MWAIGPCPIRAQKTGPTLVSSVAIVRSGQRQKLTPSRSGIPVEGRSRVCTWVSIEIAELVLKLPVCFQPLEFRFYKFDLSRFSQVQTEQVLRAQLMMRTQGADRGVR